MEKFLVFSANTLKYAVDIDAVQEIRNWTVPTQVPGSESAIEGIMNLRGQIVPLADFCVLTRRKEDTNSYDKKAIIIIKAETLTFGLSVENVSHILESDESKMKSLPETSVDKDVSFVDRIVPTEEAAIFIVNLGALTREIYQKDPLN